MNIKKDRFSFSSVEMVIYLLVLPFDRDYTGLILKVKSAYFLKVNNMRFIWLIFC